jgi:hypothetical protein
MKLSLKILILNLFLCSSYIVQGFTLHRVILATDNHENYIQFWPIVAKAWKEVIGIQPTLALIADESVKVDETLGDVIRFEPIDGVPTSLYAQCIRLLLPAYFENEGCIVSDIDMIPLSKEYFHSGVRDADPDQFVVYRDKVYHPQTPQFQMCYCAAYGNVWKEVFRIDSLDDIPAIVIRWNDLGLAWNTDERVLFHYLTHWNKYTTHCVKLGQRTTGRVDRIHWGYNPEHLKAGKYIDAHCPRPYAQYKEIVDTVMMHLLESDQVKNNEQSHVNYK